MSGTEIDFNAGADIPLDFHTDPDKKPGPDWYWCERCERWHQKRRFREDVSQSISSPSDGNLNL